MKLWGWLALASLGLSSCGGITYYITVPTYPGEPERWIHAGLYKPPIVDSLNPTLSWKPITNLGLDDSYDIIIYEAYVYPQDLPEWPIGRQIYYREGLIQPNHRIEEGLQPNHAYYWSVRVRQDKTIVSNWGRFVYLSSCSHLGTGCMTENFPFFLFMTPAE